MMDSTNIESKSENQTGRMVAIFVLVGVNALWGLSFPIMKSLNQQMEHTLALDTHEVSTTLRLAFSSGMISIRFLLSMVLLCVCCRGLVTKATRAEWGAGLLVGTFFYVGLVLQVMGLATIPASRSGFLTSLTAVFTPIFSSLFFRRSPSWNVIAGAVIALFGVSILTGFFELDGHGLRLADDALSRWTIGDTLTTLGAVLFTGQLMMVDYYGARMNTAAITPGMFLIVTVAGWLTFLSMYRFALPIEFSEQGNSSRFWMDLFLDPVFLGIVGFLAVFCSVFAFLGMNKYQPRITAMQASVIYSSEPVFASMWALFLPGAMSAIAVKYGYSNERFSLPLVIGGILILLANIVALWPRSGKPVLDMTAT